MQKTKYLIIGGGISGLTFASRKADEDYLILEREGVCGGLCRSFYEKGFVWDVAGHFFHFHSDETKRYYEQLMSGKEMCSAEKHAEVFYAGRYIDAPFQYNIHQLPPEDFLECLTDLYFADCPDENLPFGEFVQRKYGRGIADKFLIPYNEKLYACRMDELERDSMGSFLPRLDFEMLMNFYRGSKGQTYNDSFLYPANGCNEMINALLEQLDQRKIRLKENVGRIDTDKKRVYTADMEYQYEYLINTAPLSAFSGMTGNPEGNTLTYNQVLVLNLGFDRESLDKKVSWVYYPGDEIFYRIGFYNNITGSERLSLYVEIGYRSSEKIDIANALDQTLLDLKRVHVIEDHKLLACQPVVINPGYAHITRQGRAYTQKIITEMQKKDIYMIGRYARWEYSAMDDSMEQALELAKQI